MGIYQRELASFREEPILENRQTDGNCMNCHSFCQQDPAKMLFQVRAKHGCTVFVDGEKMEALDTKTEQTISTLVYPVWHPSGKYVAFSVNNTTQDTHPVHRTEVYDEASDVVVYDVEKHEILTTAALFSKKRFETFPAFSPDGRHLYFCSAPALDMPSELPDLRYSLCRIAFDPETRAFGTTVDTLFRAEAVQRSFLFPRSASARAEGRLLPHAAFSFAPAERFFRLCPGRPFPAHASEGAGRSVLPCAVPEYAARRKEARFRLRKRALPERVPAFCICLRSSGPLSSRFRSRRDRKDGFCRCPPVPRLSAPALCRARPAHGR